MNFFQFCFALNCPHHTFSATFVDELSYTEYAQNDTALPFCIYFSGIRKTIIDIPLRKKNTRKHKKNVKISERFYDTIQLIVFICRKGGINE